jgi:hypothetical protein
MGLFFFYLMGKNRDSNYIFMKVIHFGWIVNDKFKSNVFINNNVLHSYNANVFYLNSRIRFGKLKDFTTKFEI